MNNQGRQQQALALVVQSPTVSLDAKTACSLLSTSRSVRAAVLQSGGPCTAVDLTSTDRTDKYEQKMAYFATWLPTHANLLSNITVNCPGLRTAPMAAALMGLGMQQAAASSAGAALGVPPQQRPPFRLRSYSSDLDHSPSILHALPAASLTHLELDLAYQSSKARVLPAAAAALRRLTNLQELKLGLCPPPGWIPVIGALPALTRLGLAGTISATAADLSLLPTQLLHLELKVEVNFDPDNAGSVLDLSNISRLQKLDLEVCSSNDLAAAVLPTRLSWLDISCAETVVAVPFITRLQQLRHLSISCCALSTADLLSLPRLSSLSCLELLYGSAGPAVDNAAAWPRLKALQSLVVKDYEDEVLVPQRVGQLMRGVMPSRNLTRLDLRFAAHEDAAATQLVCGQCAVLSNLRDLRIDVQCSESDVVPGVVSLTRLVNLTALDIRNRPVGDMAAVALACDFSSSMQRLSLVNCGITCKTVLPVIARLRELRHLELSIDSRELHCEEALQALTRLSNLTLLELTVDDCSPSEEELTTFWKAVRTGRQQQEGQQQQQQQ